MYGNDRVNLNDPQVIKQQTEDAQTFLSMIDPWRNAIEKYAKKNDVNLEIRCKNCTTRHLSLGEFDGGLFAWTIKAIAVGHDEFEKIKTLLGKYITLFEDNASSEELAAVKGIGEMTAGKIFDLCRRVYG